jgi:hypothetical protein
MRGIMLRITASVITLALTPSSGITADVEIHVPDTREAAAATELLQRAARALSNLLRSRDEHIVSVWVYPTNSAETVYVQYTSTDSRTSRDVEHFALVTMEGDRIARLRTLP